MKNRILLLLVFTFVLSLLISGNALGAEAPVISAQAVSVDGVHAAIGAYSVDGSNYFRLRDVAYVLRGTEKEFSVSYEPGVRLVQIVTNSAYAPIGDECSSLLPAQKIGSVTQSVSVNGTMVSLDGYYIGGSYYFHIRDLAAIVGFKIEYAAATRTILISTRPNESILPVRYDLRDSGLVTTVESQDVNYSCWAYAAAAAMESNMLKDGLDQYGLASGQLDLSEHQLAYFTYASRSSDDTRLYVNPHYYGGEWNWCVGSIARGTGTALASDVPLDSTNYTAPYVFGDFEYLSTAKLYDSSIVSKSGIVHWDAETGTAALDEQALNTIKLALMANGALYCQINDSAYYEMYDPKGSGYCYSYSDDEGYDHLIDIIGWDDTVSGSLFCSDNEEPAPGDGAWIIRNSSSSAGADGGDYISYYDSTVRYITTFDMISPDTWDGTLSYDDIGYEEGAAESIGGQRWANIFTADRSESLHYVSFYTMGDNVSYAVNIYKNPEAGNPESGILVDTTEGNLPYSGYHTVALTNAVPLTADDSFSIVLSVFGLDGTSVGIEGQTSDDSAAMVNYRSDAGQSLCLLDGTWTDLSILGYGNCCIKAHMCYNETDTSAAWAALDRYCALYGGYGCWRLYAAADTLYNMIWDDPAGAGHDMSAAAFMADWYGNFGPHSQYSQHDIDTGVHRLCALMERYRTDAAREKRDLTVDEYLSYLSENGGQFVPGDDVTVMLSSATDFAAFANSVNSGVASYYGVKVVLASDLSFADFDSSAFAGGAFRGIGYLKGCFFMGSFDGQGHTISNLTIQGAALYNGVHGSSLISNLTLCDCKVTGNYTDDEGDPHGAAGIAGTNDGIIANCHVIDCAYAYSEAGINYSGDITQVTGYDRTTETYYRGVAGGTYGCSVTVNGVTTWLN